MQQTHKVIQPEDIASFPEPLFPFKGNSRDKYIRLLSDTRVQDYFRHFNEDNPYFHRHIWLTEGIDLTYLFTDFLYDRLTCGEPIRVYHASDGYVPIIDGHHRLYVAREIGVPILVKLSDPDHTKGVI